MKIRILAILVVALSFFACKNESSKYPKLSLLQYGLPIDIHAPADVKVLSENTGIMKDVTIKSEGFDVQVFSSTISEQDPKKILADLKTEVQALPYFSKFVQEDDFGFIYEKNIDGKINYDFRIVKVYGDNEYQFQRGLIGTFTEEQVRDMYNAVK